MREPELSDRQRMQVAEATGTASRYGIGRDRHRPREQALAELRKITTDRVVLGHVLAGYLYRVETESPGYGPVVELLREAGADEAAAAAELARLRERIQRSSPGLQ